MYKSRPSSAGRHPMDNIAHRSLVVPRMFGNDLILSPLEYLAPFEPALQTFLQATPSPINHLLPLLPHTRPAHKSRLYGALSETEFFVSQLNTFIEDLSELKRTHDCHLVSLQNALYAPLLALPPEIVCDIFELVMNATTPDYDFARVVQQAYRLTHISSHWRKIGISCRRLWSRINLGMVSIPQTLDMWIQRSAQGPIDVWAFKEEHANMIQHLQHRIRYLYLFGVENMRHTGGSFDRLETLFIHGPITGDFSSWNAPALRQLWLLGYDGNLIVPESLRSSVRTLSIHRPRPTSNWAHLLASFVRLERLYLLECPGIQGGVMEVMEGMSQALGSLTHLHIESVKSDLATFLFSDPSCPNLTSVFIGDIDDGSSDHKIIENEIIGFLRRSSLLHSIMFKLWVCHKMNWPSLFQLVAHHIAKDHHFLPCLRTFRLSGHTSKPETLTSNIRLLVQALHDRSSCSSNPTHKTPGHARFTIHDECIWNAEHEWYQTMDGLVESSPFEDYAPQLWEPM